VGDISIPDAFAEGACTIDEHHAATEGASVFGLGDAGFPCQEFVKLWDYTHGNRHGCTFADSPPVWIYEWAPLKGDDS
jgi:hypothetical protein